ncbi:sulfatase-like hydrolase/transferase [Neolewinella aurantiaca]|uniref:Sulfatase-like hydrolase/transferase n=1 Tax=Neolewinella aurantiaca TaxID=2602767 RepID=A0A5C7FNV6_9BACT|nr:sulfatase-like hydrolase/transferase [Neolewinella aurantiaca]TXF88062.1 sulfatase-like hydrolase/transferase [Neolewinella aurantiaca]
MRNLAPAFSALVFLALLSGCSDKNQPGNRPERPNILFIFTDDQTYTALHALGNDEIITPNLDRLVNTGTTFTHAYNMGAWNGAVCAASRAMLNSGRSVWRARELDKTWQKGDRSTVSQLWGNLMNEAGYGTYMAGKWHVSVNPALSFEHVGHVRKGMPSDGFNGRKLHQLFKRHDGHPPRDSVAAVLPPGYNRPLSETDDSYDPSDPKFGGYWEGGKHWSEVVADEGEAFLKKAATDERPFFMYLAFNAPHDPKQAPAEYLAKYTPGELTIPVNFQPVHPDKEAIGNGATLRDEALAPYPRTEFAVRTHKAEYYALITHLDTQVGRILSALEKSGKADNTVIMFTSDHGLAMGRHGLMGKQSLYEHSVRVPLIICGPGIPAGATNDQDVYLQDVMATALDLAGIEKPDYVDFNSLLPLINGEEKGLDAVYGSYIFVQRSIRKDGFKLILYPRVPRLALYDLNADPAEMNDLAAAHPERVAELFAGLQQLQREVSDTLTLHLQDYQ